jgi:hypothetical protein
MAEPARKLEDIEPEIRPNLHVVGGNGNTTSGRANLKALNNQESNPEKPSTDSVAEQEANGSNVIQGPWKNNVSNGPKSPLKAGGGFSFVKKKGPMALIITVVIGGGFGLSALFSPALLIVHLKESVDRALDAQVPTFKSETTLAENNKISETTSGYCGTTINILCKYSTMSPKQVESFKEAGIEVTGSDSFLGRTKPTEFKFQDKVITADQFTNEISTNAEFSAAFKQANPSRFTVWADDIASYVRLKTGWTKKPDLTGKNEDDVAKSLEGEVNGTKTGADVISADELKKEGFTDEQAAALVKAEEEAATAAEAAGNNTTSAAETAVLEGESAISADGLLQMGCLYYDSIKQLATLAKTVRAVQLIKFAVEFLKAADQIKAGVADPVIISGLGKILTTETLSDDGTMKAATDGLGLRNVLYGDTGNLTTSSSRFLTGGGLTGKLKNLMSTITKYTGGVSDKTCDFVNNPLVMIGAFGLGVAGIIGGAALPPLTVANVAKIGGVVVLSLAAIFLPGMLKDAVAGVLVDKNTVGEAAGDAFVSGSSNLMSKMAAAGGNAPLTPSQAVDYANYSNEVAAQYDKEDQATLSPFDITSSSTFLGKIASWLIPYTSKLSSLSGAISSISSITSRSLAYVVLPTASAYTANVDEFTQCQDTEYKSLGLATDMFCNVSYGIPPGDLDMNPISTAQYLLDLKDALGTPHPQIAEDTGAPIDIYQSYFVPTCITRTTPLGEGTTDDYGTNGENCLFGKDILIQEAIKDSDGNVICPALYVNNKYFYLHYIDQRVENDMDGI